MERVERGAVEPITVSTVSDSLSVVDGTFKSDSLAPPKSPALVPSVPNAVMASDGFSFGPLNNRRKRVVRSKPKAFTALNVILNTAEPAASSSSKASGVPNEKKMSAVANGLKPPNAAESSPSRKQMLM